MRCDDGIAFPLVVNVGQTYHDNADLYFNGLFQFEAVYEVEVLDTLPITVPYGTFDHCVHFRITLSVGGSIAQQWDEWWAHGVGVVKMQGIAGDGANRLRELTSMSIPIEDQELAAPQIQLGEDVVEFVIAPTVYGRRYQLQQSETLTSGHWDDVVAERVGNGEPLIIQIPRNPSVQRRFYRLELDPDAL